MTTTWTIFLGPSGNLPTRVEPGERACGCRHQELVALVDHTLRVARLHVGMAAGDPMLVADAANGRHRFDESGMIVLPRVTEVLRQIAFADQHHADPRHLLQDPR